MVYDLIIHSGMVMTRNKGLCATDIGILQGKILRIGSLSTCVAKEYFDASHLVVLPGCIDSQVHFREPSDNLTRKESFFYGSQCAVLGGITSVFDMPNTKPALLSYDTLMDKKKLAHDNMACNYAFYLGTDGSNIPFMLQAMREPGVCGIKVFLGSSTGDLYIENYDTFKRILQKCLRVTVHSEDQYTLNNDKEKYQEREKLSHLDHIYMRSREAACISTEKILYTASSIPSCHVHILHIGTEDEIHIINRYRDKLHTINSRVTTEVTPHHLAFMYPDHYKSMGSRVQVNPPIRFMRDQNALWEAVKSGFFDVLGSDHAPHTLHDKSRDYPDSPSGMPGVSTMIPFMLDAVNKEKITLQKFTELLCYSPSRIFRMKNKGFIDELWDADLTIVDMKKEDVVSSMVNVFDDCEWTAFEGMSLKGWPVATVIGGEIVMRERSIILCDRGKEIVFE